MTRLGTPSGYDLKYYFDDGLINVVNLHEGRYLPLLPLALF